MLHFTSHSKKPPTRMKEIVIESKSSLSCSIEASEEKGDEKKKGNCDAVS